MGKILQLIKKIYLYIPLQILNLFAPLFYLIPEKYRFGKSYMEAKNNIKANRNLTEVEYKKLIDKNFVDIISYSYEYVPYYRRIMDERNLTPKDFTSYEDVEKLPILTKEIILKESNNLISTKYSGKKLLKKQTSGSTGEPKTFCYDSSTEMVEWAYIMELWGRVGYTINSSRLVLRSKEFRELKKGKKFQWDAARRELSIDIRDMNDDSCLEYCKAIEKYKPEFIYGYPSAIFQLAQYIEKNPLKHKFKAILFVSENVTHSSRKYIENVIKCRSYTFYGHTERAILAGELFGENSYYIEPTYGYAEILNEDISDNNKEFSKGEIIVTGFLNKVMPLIRYSTGDIASWKDTDAKICHRFIDYIDGRTSDYLIDKDGNLINVTALQYEKYGDFSIDSFQFKQDKIGEVNLFVIPGKYWNDDMKNALYNFVYDDVKGKIKITIVETREMIKGKNGKQQIVVSNIKG